MNNNYSSLQHLLDILHKNAKVHINISDITGILKSPSLKIDNPNYKVHANKFCSHAKKTIKGFKTCSRCKAQSIQKAMREQKMYAGHCYYGLYEIVRPVFINGKIQCIIYVGNIIVDPKYTEKKISRTSKITKASEKNLKSCLKNCELIDKSDDHYENVARLLDSYIRLLYKYDNKSESEETMKNSNWIVCAISNYIESNHDESITLKDVSNLYYLNPKYIGRLFKQQTGQTFHEYLNVLRLNKALELLESTDESILNISIQSGFKNVTYFNRVFLNVYNQTPKQYRARLKS